MSDAFRCKACGELYGGTPERTIYRFRDRVFKNGGNYRELAELCEGCNSALKVWLGEVEDADEAENLPATTGDEA